MMKNNKTYLSVSDSIPQKWAFLISLAAHLLLIGFVMIKPHWQSPEPFVPSVIDVQMVDLKDIAQTPGTKGADPKPAAAPPKEPTPEPEAPVEKEETQAVLPVEKETEPEISTAPPKKKTKVALKYKTFKPKRVLDKAIAKIEKQVEASPPKPLEETIKRLREKVEKDERPGQGAQLETDETNTSGRSGLFARGSQQEIELIDIYRADIATQINTNWAFSEQLAGIREKLFVRIVFKIMPDGKIEDIFFLDRSGNQYLDDSAFKAIVKSSPVKPHPAGLRLPYVQMGLRFTPEGVY